MYHWGLSVLSGRFVRASKTADIWPDWISPYIICLCRVSSARLSASRLLYMHRTVQNKYVYAYSIIWKKLLLESENIHTAHTHTHTHSYEPLFGVFIFLLLFEPFRRFHFGFHRFIIRWFLRGRLHGNGNGCVCMLTWMYVLWVRRLYVYAYFCICCQLGCPFFLLLQYARSLLQ